MHALADLSTGDWVGGASVNAEFIIEDWSVDAGGRERVPVFMDNVCEGCPVSGGKGVGKLDDGVKFGLVKFGVPEDAICAPNAEVEWGGCGTEGGTVAVRREEVEVFVDVVRCVVGLGVSVDGFWSENFGWDLDH